MRIESLVILWHVGDLALILEILSLLFSHVSLLPGCCEGAVNEQIVVAPVQARARLIGRHFFNHGGPVLVCNIVEGPRAVLDFIRSVLSGDVRPVLNITESPMVAAHPVRGL